ncbi:hypothetical protein [Bradyrhizobium lablabi]|nr:hypothetical protein [Bradyrhizobium lablabi]MBR0695806.1 hypothetical protein [Bradyrhizobium lablabi]
MKLLNKMVAAMLMAIAAGISAGSARTALQKGRNAVLIHACADGSH